ncbi:uncharacterized protein DNG_10498 [Cephalotrichum gorgonifer]|uniref:Uncharacterized protein n=1 Tax=Cephalotrichum gorgonifer TaxID=2041049 RepID=A0AAE8N925_9PEZI|nr:uncharacterized protein DNG_10498 [Cephalotrichum gorgonifer]
MSPAIENLI